MTSHRYPVMVVIVALLLAACPRATVPSVRPGIDVLLSDSLHLVRGRKVGLVTNRTGVDAQGRSDIDRLREAGIELVALFSPEHGFRGHAAPGEKVGSTRDSATGLPIYSLYGAVRVPTPEMLSGIDLLLVDLQDVGARYYTYISTTIDVMRGAGPQRIPVIVLDRPNPVAAPVQGNVLDTAFRSYIGALAVPMRHGLTLGEQALLARSDLGLDSDLRIVPVSGWRRSQYFDETGLPFIPPSPNLQTLGAILLYPGTCLFEGTNLSVGRGTPEAFAQVGAPWLDPGKVIAAVGPIAGIRAEPVSFTPSNPGDQKYSDTTLSGIRLTVTDRRAYDPVEAAVRLLAAIKAVHPGEFRFLARQFDRLAGDSALRTRLDRGENAGAVMADWEAGRHAFMGRRAHFLLYPD